MLAILGFLLSGLTVLLCWVKLRRLIPMARRLQRVQLVLMFACSLVRHRPRPAGRQHHQHSPDALLPLHLSWLAGAHP